ncbi:MAG TPA: hypothetical protein VD866_18490, partial [Urbifossiella sp.]|nr:hypothetical protein [Urbifossiella sp.]
MGHAQIDHLPRTKEWRAVAALLRGNADAPTVARAVVDAARTLIPPARTAGWSRRPRTSSAS